MFETETLAHLNVPREQKPVFFNALTTIRSFGPCPKRLQTPASAFSLSQHERMTLIQRFQATGWKDDAERLVTEQGLGPGVSAQDILHSHHPLPNDHTDNNGTAFDWTQILFDTHGRDQTLETLGLNTASSLILPQDVHTGQQIFAFLDSPEDVNAWAKTHLNRWDLALDRLGLDPTSMKSHEILWKDNPGTQNLDVNVVMTGHQDRFLTLWLWLCDRLKTPVFLAHDHQNGSFSTQNILPGKDGPDVCMAQFFDVSDLMEPDSEETPHLDDVFDTLAEWGAHTRTVKL